MCGIIGISSNKSVSANIINSLKKLEYRGYDSAGIATLSDGEIYEVKSEGRVDNLESNFDLKNFLKTLINDAHYKKNKFINNFMYTLIELYLRELNISFSKLVNEKYSY